MEKLTGGEAQTTEYRPRVVCRQHASNDFVDSGTANFIGTRNVLDYATYRREKTGAERIINSRRLRNIDEAFYWIADANDTVIDLTERSNLFDSWKDVLEHSMASKDGLSISQHEVLGALIVATKSKDISDFDTITLKIFQEATNILRQDRVLEVDSERIIEGLLGAGASLSIPLNTKEISPAEEESLDSMMAELLVKSREND